MKGRPQWIRSLRLTAGAAIIFCVIVGAFLVLDNFRGRTTRLVDAEALAVLRQSLLDSPKDEAVKESIRQLDHELRVDYFARQRRTRQGAWLLLAGAVVIIASLSLAAGLGASTPLPPAHALPDVARRASQSRWAVAAVGAMLLGAAFGVARRPDLTIPALAVTPPGDAPVVEVPVELRWPRFRGPGGLAIATGQSTPIRFDPGTGEKLAWRVEIPLTGQSSPIVWGNQIFVTGANSSTRQLYSYSLEDGKLLWQANVIGGARAMPENVLADTGYAAPTPATDGKRVVAMFANGDIAAFSFQGAPLWATNLGVPVNIYGHAASPILWDDLVIVQFDQGMDGDGSSFLYALDAGSGKVRWKTPREAPNTWSTPIIIESGGAPQIVSTGSPWIVANNPTDGAEIWKVNLFYGEVVTAPVFANDLVYVASAFAYAAAIRPDGEGDLTESHILWKNDLGLPDIVSPLCDGERLLLCMAGMLTCLNAADGELLWEHDLEGDAWASPTMVGDAIYLPLKDGDLVVFTMKDGYEELARNPMGEALNASIAVAGGNILVRGSDHLFCFREEAP